MNEIYIDIRSQNKWIKERFPEKDFVSIEDFLSEFETLLDEIENLDTKYKDLKQEVEDNYVKVNLY